MFCPSSSFVALVGLTFAISSCWAQTIAQVNLRVEGATTTIFEGVVATSAHNVTTASGGNHFCNGENPITGIAPGPSMTSALDNATLIANPVFKWDGPFNTTLGDFNITAIGGDAQSGNQAWILLHNFNFVTGGGCLQRVGNASNVLFAFGPIGPDTVFLNLTGPTQVSRDQPQIKYTVWNGNTNKTVAGAFIPGFGNVSGDDGVITGVFKSTGVFSLKAQRSDSIRSNSLQVGVFDEPPSSSSVSASSSVGASSSIGASSSVGASTSVGPVTTQL